MNKLSIIINEIERTRGEDINIYRSGDNNPYIDYIVLCSADSFRQVYAIANNIKDELKANHYDIRSFEGKKDSKWILLDLDDVIVHVFLSEEREMVALDELYQDLAKVELDDLR